MKYQLDTHLVQTDLWGKFKTSMGNTAVKVGNIQLTKHKIPATGKYVGYAPRVNFLTQKFNFKELKATAIEEDIAFIRFDVPNVLKYDTSYDQLPRMLMNVEDECRIAPRSTFATYNVLLDISKPEEELIKNFSSKTRYNTKLAAKKGVKVRIENSEDGFENFFKLLSETAKRQKFSIHSKKYYKNAYEIFSAEGLANILIAYYENEPLVAWMLFNYQNTMYYPYGGSSTKHRNLMASNLMAWEAIKLAKKKNTTVFDMWGATNDKDSPWWGFTRFKLGYGGDLVEYMPSRDFVVSKSIYYPFNFAYNTFWKLKKLR